MMWMEVRTIFKVTNDINFDTPIDEDEDIVDKIKREESGVTTRHERGVAYIDVLSDPIVRLIPGALYENENKSKTYFTELHFYSGIIVNAIGKPPEIYEKLKNHFEHLIKEGYVTNSKED